MNADGGYTRSFRRKWDNPIFRNKAEAAVWAWMCDVAQYQNHTLRTKFGPVELRPGELVMSERELADDFNLHRNTLRSLLNRMVDEGMISLIRDRIPHRAGTIVKIIKYIEYQGFNGHSYEAKDRKNDTTGTVARTEEGPQKDQEQVSKYTEDKGGALCVSSESPPCACACEATPTAPPVSFENKSVNVVPFAPPGGRQPIPAGWVLPDEWRSWALGAGLTTPDLSALKFLDHWRDKGSAKDAAGWRVAWEWWVRKDIEWERKHGQQRHAGRQRQKSGGGLVAYALAEVQRNPGFAEGDPDDGGWR